MDKLYELKEMLCKELEEYGSKGKMDVGSLEVVDKLAHAIKNIDKIIEAKESGGYSGEYYGDDGMSNRSYRRSYARGRGSNAKRDSMGRYASRGGSYADGESYADGGSYARGYSRAEDDFRMELQEIMQSAPNDNIRHKIQAMINEM